ncbi:MAG: hypothetical protein ACI9TA_003257 [Reinekea sp.]|jgi:hypothetical protein
MYGIFWTLSRVNSDAHNCTQNSYFPSQHLKASRSAIICSGKFDGSDRQNLTHLSRRDRCGLSLQHAQKNKLTASSFLSTQAVRTGTKSHQACCALLSKSKVSVGFRIQIRSNGGTVNSVRNADIERPPTTTAPRPL